MASFERASPALKEILLRIYRAEKPIEVDHHLYEFGSVEYHIKSSASDPQFTYLSISTPLLTQGFLLSRGLSPYAIQMVKEISTDVLEIVEPANEGYQLTIRLDFSKIPHEKDSLKIITEVSSVQAVILSSQLKEMLLSVNSWDASLGTSKPIKLVYHPREPFYVIRQPQKIIAVFPMRFKEHSDVIIATSFFQELMDVGSSEKWAKVPPCSWSPIPPPELRGEPFEDLSTNGGFVSFGLMKMMKFRQRKLSTSLQLSFRQIFQPETYSDGFPLEQIYFHAMLKLPQHSLPFSVLYLISTATFFPFFVTGTITAGALMSCSRNLVQQCTRGFIQRRMRKRLDSLVKVLS
ncbi:ARP2/3 complex, 34kDa subunit (p34-Arc) [Corchorus olitorius]|uniref:Arp2/3 complex 34 kDa subunit n=1 Tax=Corchorus olitorius TaxID=93759 RepID=A0A1R3JKN3_9ROSI|nr:ARP2/3 complex, 34kDa subunit (p34-Arc) [Corchorus olitorius]